MLYDKDKIRNLKLALEAIQDDDQHEIINHITKDLREAYHDEELFGKVIIYG